MRYAARSDASQPQIVAALRAAGVSVWVIKWPVDLLCGFHGRSIALEVKEKGGRLTDDQREFFSTFKGEAYIVRGIADALKAVKG